MNRPSWLPSLSLSLLAACTSASTSPEVRPPEFGATGPGADASIVPLHVGGPEHHSGRLGIPLWTVAILEGRPVPSQGKGGHQRLGELLISRVNGEVLLEEVRLPMTNQYLHWLWPVDDPEDRGPKTFFAYENVWTNGFAEGQYCESVQGIPMYPVWEHELRILRPAGVWDVDRDDLLEAAGLEPWWEPEEVLEQKWRPRD